MIKYLNDPIFQSEKWNEVWGD